MYFCRIYLDFQSTYIYLPAEIELTTKIGGYIPASERRSFPAENFVLTRRPVPLGFLRLVVGGKTFDPERGGAAEKCLGTRKW